MFVPGDIIAGRFELEAVAGEGGMGRVFRARDVEGGGMAALKAMLGDDALAAERFERESATLARLRHPRIVRYLAHGRDRGRPWLAMEWLEGVALSTWLTGRQVSIEQAISIAAQTAEALALLHGRGIVHRDVKPSNLFLSDKDPERLKLLDFGTARQADTGLTRTGVVVGTPGYLAPELVQGATPPDPRADLFALGCVLFECLTGRAAFQGDRFVAVRAKILLEPTPRPSELVLGVPPALDDLTMRLLAKDPDERPSDARVVLTELVAMRGGELPTFEAPMRPARPAITMGEQRIFSVILALDIARDSRPPPAAEPVSTPPPDAQITVASSNRALLALRRLADRFGARIDDLGAGGVVVTLEMKETAQDHAAEAARCALALRAELGTAFVAMATGPGTVGARVRIRDTIDRAAALLSAARRSGPSSSAAIWLDETTAALLDGRFEVQADERGLRLLGERPVGEAERALLGAAPFVGRERELAFLLGLFDDCIEERRARAVLVTGPAGAGKSRILRELLSRVGARQDPPVVFLARAESVRAASPFALVARLVARSIGLTDDEPAEERRRRLEQAVAARVPDVDVARVVEFLAELVGAPFPDDRSARLAAARRSPPLMADQLRAALRDWLAGASAKSPVLILLEDVHWGDGPSFGILDHALRKLENKRIFVVAVGRNEVQERFPALALGRELDNLRLGDLSRRASEALARAALGADAAPELIEKIAERGAGNALYLEELLRAANAGRTSELPGSVLAMIAARLDALEPGARRVLRAASVFGEVFWTDGVAELLGGELRRDEARDWLVTLAEREIIQEREVPRLGGQSEHAFRHPLFRDAAYALLTDADRELGHRLAAGWLERAGESDTTTLAGHYQRGGRPERAAGYLLRSADLALRHNEPKTALAIVTRALSAGLRGEDLGRARLLEGLALNWLAVFDRAETLLGEAIELLPVGSEGWCEAATTAALIAGKHGGHARMRDLAIALASLVLLEGPSAAYAIACTRVTTALTFVGELELAKRLLSASEPAVGAHQGDLMVEATYSQASGTIALFDGDAFKAKSLLERAAAAFETIGDVRGAAIQRGNCGNVAVELGQFQEAVRILRTGVELADAHELPNVASTMRQNLGVALGRLGHYEEALALEEATAREFAKQGDVRLEGSSFAYIAQIQFASGHLDAAERAGRRAVEILQIAPPLLATALATLARTLLSLGRVDEALERAREAYALVGALEEGESLVRLAWIECLRAVGRRREADEALEVAVASIQKRAARIPEGEARERFLRDVEENAETVLLRRSS